MYPLVRVSPVGGRASSGVDDLTEVDGAWLEGGCDGGEEGEEGCEEGGEEEVEEGAREEEVEGRVERVTEMESCGGVGVWSCFALPSFSGCAILLILSLLFSLLSFAFSPSLPFFAPSPWSPACLGVVLCASLLGERD